jgi:hypothetical protein
MGSVLGIEVIGFLRNEYLTTLKDWYFFFVKVPSLHAVL